MKKSKRMLRKLLLLTSSALLLVSLTVGVTLAYLTDTDSVTNTFTVGKVGLSMDELDVDNDTNTSDNKTYGTGEDETIRDKANEYHLLPGQTYIKDPIVHIDADSEDGWLFVLVENEIAAIEGGITIAQQMANNGWQSVEGEDNLYAYREVVTRGNDYPVFETFTISGDNVDNATLAAYQGKSVKVTAYLVQAAGFDTAAEALATVGTPDEWEIPNVVSPNR